MVDAFKACGKLSGGEFPDSVGLLGQLAFIVKHTKERFKSASNDEVQKITREISPITRGFQFGLELPASAGAYYAGKGVKQGTVEKPIFWYKPEGSTKYRVIHADLTVKDADTAPQVSGADRLNKASQIAQPNEK